MSSRVLIKPHGKRRKKKQVGGQLGALLPLLKFVGPVVAAEAIKFGVQTALRKTKKGKKRKKGKGLKVAGSGLRLAGQRGKGLHGGRRVKRRGKMRKSRLKSPGHPILSPSMIRAISGLR